MSAGKELDDRRSGAAFGQMVRAAREKAGRSLNEFAREMGASPAYWSKIERGLDNPPRDELIVRAAVTLLLDVDAAFVAAERLPPDLRDDLAGVVAACRARPGPDALSAQEWLRLRDWFADAERQSPSAAFTAGAARDAANAYFAALNDTVAR